ncbi:MAG: GNAT family N-acetyltransferase [Proteobacteria bacterium]|nr:GNAT family N-acetyltransferase [Pseudomonadota bacterium]MBI3498227.1 GNAT family N-acetyltransferase [Pseudomonadota bacterium]
MALHAAEFESERLRLRWPRLADAAALFAFMGDADSMRLTQRLRDLRECRRYLAAHACQRRKLGYGPWVVLDKSDGRIVGFGGLYDDPFEPGWGIEVSYRFAPAAWGKGYASELTKFCLTLASEQLGLGEVKAFALPDNTASRRVLEKNGFKQVRFLPAMNRCLYVWRPGPR